LQLHGSAKRGDGLPQMTGFGACDPEFQIDGRGVRLLATQRFEDGERVPSPSSAPKGGAQDEAGGGMRTIDVQNFLRLFRGEVGILL
jgi:hypothetical protein